ncbi:LacI family DNA-binding transcriptional regulator [Amycolatopsis rhabdoformis]|uniref:LacI family DNA-binding transcriptional regulator n=1 Tax=Amycolatopsis rhabdoformis TaxID=1448059 RepID=A0ABZ1IC23_9PSEU|nr:LacI family DNA-binding transcriptional regulator [Amycolatopsis rhabdoformis]WSE32024.1 LacI family DNA-binding transcriptional regulator [Amycolatopsis rhabdoformis]
MNRPPTIKDVAERAGVHAATASRALNPATRGMVNARTANRVAEAARALGYAPNSAARSLRTRTSSVAGVLVPDLRNPVFPPIVRGIEDGLRDAGYMALVGNTDGDPERERELVTAMRGRQIDGFILATSSRSAAFAADVAVPTVLVNRRTDNGGIPSVTADNAAGIHLLVRHLAELGHTRLGHVAGPRELSTGWERYRAYLDATASAGLEPVVEFADAFTETAGHAATLRLLSAHPELTAVLAGNDLIALGCYSALADLGRTVPGDVSVTGFNDMPFVDRQRPSLTTVRIPHYDLGREAARLLLERIAAPDSPAKRVVLPVELVSRDSTAPVKS